MFSLESPHRGDSNEYTQYTILNIKLRLTLNDPKSAAKFAVKSNEIFSGDSRMSSKQPW